MSERTPAGEYPAVPATDGEMPPAVRRARHSRGPRHSVADDVISDGDGVRPAAVEAAAAAPIDSAGPASGEPNGIAPAAVDVPAADVPAHAQPADEPVVDLKSQEPDRDVPGADVPGADVPGADVPEAEPGAEASDGHGARVRHWREQSRKRRTDKRKRPWWVELPILVVIAFILTFLIQTFVARVYYVPSGSMEHTLHGTTNGGDRILAFKMVYDFRGPEQGEVVVFKGPATWTPEANIPGPTTWYGKAAQALGSVIGIAPPNEKDYVKRVIAVGGQTISCCDAKGRVQVDGVSLAEPYLFMENGNPQYAQWQWIDGESNCGINPNDPSRYNSIRCFGPYKVPKGTVWMMGDHRPDSADSSYFCRGLVPAKNVHCQGPIPVKDVIGKAVAIVMPPSRWGGIGSPDIMSAPPGSK